MLSCIEHIQKKLQVRNMGDKGEKVTFRPKEGQKALRGPYMMLLLYPSDILIACSFACFVQPRG